MEIYKNKGINQNYCLTFLVKFHTPGTASPCNVVKRQCRLTRCSVLSNVPLTAKAGVDLCLVTGTVNNEKHLLGAMFFTIRDQG